MKTNPKSNPRAGLRVGPRVGLVVPHIFLHRDILPQVIFSPGHLAIDLANGLQTLGADTTLFTPGSVETMATNINADMSYFEQELAARGDSYIDLLKKHPFTFVTLARQVQSEIVAKAYAMANAGELDVVHIYTNEEDIALPFAGLCTKPVVFTHHDPFNFLVKYKNVFPKYRQLNWISLSLAQRAGMPVSTNWVDNIYHGVDGGSFRPVDSPSGDYFAYFGRIIEPKGLHLAVAAAKAAGVKLKIAGKHYGGDKDTYWQETVEPQLGGMIEYAGFIRGDAEKRSFLGNAQALLVPSTYSEPFGMVSIEALASATPVIGLDCGATKEIVEDGKTGFIVPKQAEEAGTIAGLVAAMHKVGRIKRSDCRQSFENRFTLERMCREHLALYQKLTK
jgi:glycosyltransferase involved in cell wall biosynthesis